RASHPRARPGRAAGDGGEGPSALLAGPGGGGGGRAHPARAQGAGTGTAADRRLRLLRPAAGRTGDGLRRAVADRVDGLRPRSAARAGHRRGRTHRRVHPHRHPAGTGTRARTPRSARAADGLDAMTPDGPALPAAAAPAQTLHLVDASLYVFRAWHSMPDEFRDAQGWPTNAVHGFARFLLELLERER